MKTWITWIVAMLAVLSTWAQAGSLKVVTDKEQILIGEQIEMTVELRGASADSFRLPSIGDTLRKEIEVLSRTEPDTSYEGANLEQKVLRQSYTITSFDSGYFPVKPLVGYINSQPVASNAFLVGVQTLKIDTAKGIADIKDIEQVPFAWQEWLQETWHWFVLAMAAAGLITWLVLYLSKEKTAAAPEVVIPSRPAHEIALERIVLLREEELWQKGKIKTYYSELTDILREFIEHRFAIPALEQTTDEIVSSMARYPDFSEEERLSVKRLLFLADLVKFAKEKPVGQENETHLATVESFVQSFVPTPESPEKAASHV
ncbi:MAG: hypothetical protein RLP15_00210 [Cryomorphaceae bacterium]